MWEQPATRTAAKFTRMDHDPANDFLPELPGMIEAPQMGRNVYQAYQRGLAIRSGRVWEKAHEDPAFQHAYALSRGRTLIPDEKLLNLYLLIRFYLPRLEAGDIIEFGTYRGGSALFMARLAATYCPGATVWALDTFDGMPWPDKRVDLHGRGDFADADVTELGTAAEAAGVDNLRLVKGMFQDTAPGVIAEAQKILLAHIDCDLRSAIIAAWRAVRPAMADGGYVVFDDATEPSCIGATQAVEEEMIRAAGLSSEQIWPHFVFRYPPL